MQPNEAARLREALDRVASRNKRIRTALNKVGYPEPRTRPAGFHGLLRIIVGQQISVHAASAIWKRIEHAGLDFAGFAQASEEKLRQTGMSRAKIACARAVITAVQENRLDLNPHPSRPDGDIIREFCSVRGIGRWSADIYMLFCLRRYSAFPAGDLAIRKALAQIYSLDAPPTEAEARLMAERFHPAPGAVAVLLWKIINMDRIL